MKIVVFGAGYVGLVTATGLAELGNEVLCIDIDAGRVDALNAGKIPIHEKGLPELLARNRAEDRISFATSVDEHHRAADFYFIAVATPPLADGSADVSAVLAVATTIARMATQRAVVAVKSTVPVGTCEAVQAVLDEHGRHGLECVSNPEFLKEGTAVEDFLRPDRVVCGVRAAWAGEAMRALYASLQLSRDRTFLTDVRTSELIKYAANAMLAMRVSFMNEMAQLCDAVGADVRDLRLAVGADSRIGPKMLYPGPGYGGSCFPKDVRALVQVAQRHGAPHRLLQATHEANEAQRVYVMRKVQDACGGDVRGKRVALWGLAYKSETDDVRESAATFLAPRLVDLGAEVVAHDPEASARFAAACPGVRIAAHQNDAFEGADVLVILTEWRSYRSPDFALMRQHMRAPNIVDARNVWGHLNLPAMGFRYRAIGLKGAIHG